MPCLYFHAFNRELEPRQYHTSLARCNFARVAVADSNSRLPHNKSNIFASVPDSPQLPPSTGEEGSVGKVTDLSCNGGF